MLRADPSFPLEELPKAPDKNDDEDDEGGAPPGRVMGKSPPPERR